MKKFARGFKRFLLNSLPKTRSKYVCVMHSISSPGMGCCGRTPMQTLIDAKEVWDEKVKALN